MTHSELVAKLCKPGADILKDLTPESAHILHMAVGISGEVAELFEQIALRNAGDHQNILEEAGDLLFYIEGLLQGAGLSRGNAKRIMEVSEWDGEPNDLDGLVARAGDVLDLAKKHAVYGKPLDGGKMGYALAWCQLHLLCLLDKYGMTMCQAKEHNIAKLTVRYGEKYSNEAAQERKDKSPLDTGLPCSGGQA